MTGDRHPRRWLMRTAHSGQAVAAAIVPLWAIGMHPPSALVLVSAFPNLAAEAEHVHLVCSQCGRVTQIGPEEISPLVTALDGKYGFETDVGHLTVYGRCTDCRGQAAG